DLTMPAERARLHDQLGGFGNGHEIAPHVGMGDQDRAPRPDLPEERRDHAAAAAQHIAEAYRYEVAPVLDGGLLHYELGHALGKPAAATGTYGVVGGDADEVLRSGLDRGADDVEGAEHIVEDRLADVGLHQRHMLVCGGVEDGARLVGPDDLRDARRVPDIGDERNRGQVRVGLAEHGLDLEDRVLSVPDEQHPPRLHPPDLPAELTAD